MITIDNEIRIPRNYLSRAELRLLERNLNFEAGDQSFFCMRDAPNGDIIVPRGAWQWLPDRVEIIDRRSYPELTELPFEVELDFAGLDKTFYGQNHALDAMVEHEQGIIHRPPG